MFKLRVKLFKKRHVTITIYPFHGKKTNYKYMWRFEFWEVPLSGHFIYALNSIILLAVVTFSSSFVADHWFICPIPDGDMVDCVEGKSSGVSQTVGWWTKKMSLGDTLKKKNSCNKL